MTHTHTPRHSVHRIPLIAMMNLSDYGSSIKNVCIFHWNVDPPVRIRDGSVVINPRNLPYYVCSWTNPLSADVIFEWFPMRRAERRMRGREIAFRNQHKLIGKGAGSDLGERERAAIESVRLME